MGYEPATEIKIFQYQCKLNVFLLFVIVTQIYTVVNIVKIVRPYHCLLFDVPIFFFFYFFYHSW